MPFQCQQRVVPTHSKTIIRNNNRGPSAGFDGDCNPVSIGIESILNEFLDDGGRPFHDFAGGDLIGNVFWKEADAVHSAPRFRKWQGC